MTQPKRVRTDAQRVRRALLKRLRELEDTLGGWKATSLITWLMPPIENALAPKPKRKRR